MSRLTGYWKGLTARERRITSAGSVLFMIILFVFLLWLPMQDKLDRVRIQVNTQVADLEWIQQQVPLINRLKKKPVSRVSGSNLPLLTLIDQTAKRSKVRKQIKQIQPGKEENTAKVWFDKVLFENWLRWIDQLTAKGVVIDSVSITRSTVQPAVNIRMDVARR